MMIIHRNIYYRVCGVAEINIDLLKEKTHYEGLSESEPCIQYFWDAVSDIFLYIFYWLPQLGY
jgi:hypothetical protein